jgi:hypothetical protein
VAQEKPLDLWSVFLYLNKSLILIEASFLRCEKKVRIMIMDMKVYLI